MAPQTDAMRLIARARGILDDVLDDDRLGRGVHASHIERALQELAHAESALAADAEKGS